MNLNRRDMMMGAAGVVAASPFAPPVVPRGPDTRCNFTGAVKQGGLVIGRAPGGQRVSVDGTPVNLSAAGTFAFGFAFDRTDPSHVAIGYADGSREELDVLPIVRQYEVQAISGLPPKLVSPSAKDQARIDREHALVAEVRKTDSDSIWFSDPFDWPATGIISSAFGSSRSLNGVKQVPHFGVDIAAGAGAPILAPASGRVLIAEEFLLEGNFTMLDHGHGVFTSYMHQSKHLVKSGENVDRGQKIGLVGQTGRATGPHLHWGMNWFQVRLDPSLSTRSVTPTRS